MGEKLQSLRYSVAKTLHGHQAFVILMAVLVVLTGLFLQMYSLNNLPADEQYYQDQASTIKTVNFNQDAIKEIEALRDSNVQTPGTALPDSRSNPFVE